MYIRPQEANDMEFKEQHQAEIWRSSAALIRLDDIGSLKIVCESVNGDLKILI